ncbi:MAG: hypothetical protein U0R26_11160 [Solirubrobacterales bacterium]
MLRKLKEHMGIAALVVAVMALFVALSGIAGALPGGERKAPKLKVVERTAEFGPIASGAAGNGVANCNGGEKAVGGGFSAESGFGRLDGSRPELTNGKPTGWHVFVGNNSPGNATFEVEVLCASTK